MIPVEAVEAAYRELPDGAGVYVNRDDLRVILEAAAPHMLAAAWEAGCKKGLSVNPGWDDVALDANPYRTTK